MASAFTDLLNDTITVLSGKKDNLWSRITGFTDEDAKAYGISVMMDSIISSSLMKDVYETVMMNASARQAIRNTKGGAIVTGSGVSGALQSAVNIGYEAATAPTALTDISVLSSAGISSIANLISGEMQELWEKTLMVPNIEGVPISTATIETSRDVDVGDQVMIVQSTSQKRYWTDNAVPKMKEWVVSGYITPQLLLDSMYAVKPSLKIQHEFLDICAASRRPVLFKDNRGEFIFVQIMSLHTTEEASYNNAIKVTISLKEYKPFTVNNVTSLVDSATQDASILAALGF